MKKAETVSSPDHTHINNNTPLMIALASAITDQVVISNGKCTFSFLQKRMKETGFSRREVVSAVNQLVEEGKATFIQEIQSRGNVVPFAPDAVVVFVRLVGGSV